MPKIFERCAWTAGVVLLVVWSTARFAGAWSAHRDVARFAATSQSPATVPAPTSTPDTSLWSPNRIRGYQASLERQLPSVLAVLRIPKIKLEVPILEGTDEWTLNRGVGHIEDTPRPGVTGNVGIVGHRDGFFRGLKDIHVGDSIELDTGTAKTMYRIERIWIVKPEDVSVLDPTPGPALTLVTCYPFFFVGSAPDRYIVRAVPSTQPSSR
jgi:sortase A